MTGRLLGLILVVLLSSVSMASNAREIDGTALPPLAGTWTDCASFRMIPKYAGTKGPAVYSIVHKSALATPAMDPPAARHCNDVTTQFFHSTTALELNSGLLNPIDHAAHGTIDAAQFRHASAASLRDMKDLTAFKAELVVSSGEDPDAKIGWLYDIMNSPAVALLALAIIGMAAVARRTPISAPWGPIA